MRHGCLPMLFAPFVLIGVFMLGMALYSFGLLLATLSWEPISATLVKTSIPATSARGTNKIDISYDYTYQGKNYNSVELLVRMPFQGGGTKKTYKKLHDHLLNLNRIQVYVNPKQPADATVYRGPTNANWRLLYMAIIWSSITSLFTFANYFSHLSKHFVKVYAIVAVGLLFLSPLLFSVDLVGDYPVRGVVNLEKQAVRSQE